MRATHNGGGLLGAVANGLGWDTDDVETMPEATMGLQEQGYLDYNPDTGQWERTNRLGMAPFGVGVDMAAPVVGKTIAQQAENMPAGVGAYHATKKAGDIIGPSGSSVGKAIGGLASFAGIPGASTLTHGYGLLDAGARLSYAGVPAPDNPNLTAPRSQSFDGDRPHGSTGGGSQAQPINPTMQQAPGWILPQWHWSQYA